MTNEKMPSWPDTKTFLGLKDATQFGDQWAYQRARADAAMERLKLAVEALLEIESQSRFDEDGIYYKMACIQDAVERASVAIVAIGPLPPSTEPEKAGG